MFAEVATHDDALRESIEVLCEIVSLYDRLGLAFPAAHVATAIHAARSALEGQEISPLSPAVDL